ncbi:MAG: glycosyltransferase [Candidatus Methanomethylicia archaeon]
MEPPTVSIVIPTLNSARYIDYCIRSVFNQTFRDFEVIVVDGGSVDDTLSRISKYDVKIIRAKPGRSWQKNIGAYNARGEYIYFLDSDFYIGSKVIEECVNKCRNGFDAIVIGLLPWIDKSFLGRVLFWHKIYTSKCSVKVAARFMRREVFLSVGGFDNSLYFNEDLDLHRRIRNGGYRIGYVDSYQYHLGESRSIGEYIRRYLYYAPNIGLYVKHNPRESILHIASIHHILKAFRETPSKLIPYILALEIIRLTTIIIGYIVGNVKYMKAGLYKAITRILRC